MRIAAAFARRLGGAGGRDVAFKHWKWGRAPKRRAIPVHGPAKVLMVLLFVLARNGFVRVDTWAVLDLLLAQADVNMLRRILDRFHGKWRHEHLQPGQPPAGTVH